MDSADSQWILPLCVYAYLYMCASHARLQHDSGSALGCVSIILRWSPTTLCLVVCKYV